LESIAESTTA